MNKILQGGEMVNRSKRKGYRLEYDLVDKLRELGFSAERVPHL